MTVIYTCVRHVLKEVLVERDVTQFFALEDAGSCNAAAAISCRNDEGTLERSFQERKQDQYSQEFGSGEE